MSTILVTGGTGFLGSYIIKELVERNYSVRAIRRNSSKLPLFIPGDIFKRVEWVEGDVLDQVSLEESLENVSAVIHAAAMVSFYKQDKDRMYRVNVQGTANVVNAMLESNVSRLVHISSVAALGRSAKSALVTEEKKWHANKENTHYAISKYKSEMEVWRGMGEGLDAVIVNPSTVLGYGDWNSSSCRIFKTIYHEFPWYSTGINGFVDIEDVARVTVMLMKSDIHDQRFIVNADNWSFQRLFNTIADGFNKRHPRIRATPFLGEVAWRVEKLKSFMYGERPLLTKETARVAHSHTFFGNDKIRAALPEFSFMPLEKSIQNACRKYLDTINAA